MSQKTFEKQRIHPVVKLDFFVRLVACPIPALIVISARLSAGDEIPWWLWGSLVFYALVWPHVAFFFARQTTDLVSREQRFLVFDAGVAGVAIGLTSFQTVPTIALVTGYASILASVGGVPLLLKGLSALVGGALLTGSLFTGLTMTAEAPVLSTALAALAVVSFQTMMGLLTYRTARNLVQTRRRIAEQSDEILGRNQELVQAREEALQAAQAKAAFLATMSHEIRTPLNGVLGMTLLLAETPLSHQQRDLLDTIQVSGNTLLTVINDVLDYSRIESGHLELESEPLAVTRVVEEALEIVAEHGREKGIELVCDVARQVPETIRGDVTRLRQVLTNLVGNAVKFTESGEVVIRVRQTRAATDETPAELSFEVRDTGIGIPEDRIPSLFSAFSQADASTTRKYGGTGLGLAISKRLTELMGGTISVQSTEGTGTTVVFTLQAFEDAREPVSRIDKEGMDFGKRILVVDDNATNRRVLCASLEGWGFEVESRDGAVGALEALASEPRFDLAILDLHMPEVDGFTLARRIRELPSYGDLPMILLSSSLVQANDDPERLFSAHLMKPARQSRMYDAVVDALAADQRERPTEPSEESIRQISAGAPLTILVADDNEINRKVVGLVLRRFGYQADFVENGHEAVDRVVHRALSGDDEAPYDIVFMDVHMPDMDGLEATRAIRQLATERPDSAWPRIVAMTADAMQGDREICLEAGMDDYLTKPLDLGAVQAVLEQTASGSSPVSKPVEQEALTGESPQEAVEPPPVVDWSRLEELREFDTPEGTVVQGAIDAFFEQAPVRLVEVRRSSTDRDGPGLRESAHGLKGAAANIGAVAVARSAAQLEKAGKQQSFEEAGSLVEILSMALIETLVALHRKPRLGSEKI